MRSVLVLVLMSAFTMGCAAKLRLPGNRFLTPESSGGSFKGNVKLGMAGTADVQVADDVTASSPDTTPDIGENSDPVFGATLGLVNRLDAYYTSVTGAGDVVGVKFQFLGEPQPAAKKGNFSLALAGGAIFGSHDDSSTVNNIEGKATYTTTGYEGLVLLGYRPVDNTLFYLAPFVSHVEADIKIERTDSGTTTVTAQPDGVGDMKGATLGLRFGKDFFLNLEASYFTANWKRTNPTDLEAEEFSEALIGGTVGGSW